MLISETWEKAWGKLPTRRPVATSYSSASRPTSLRMARSRSKIWRALAVRPWRHRLSAYQKVHARKAPSPGGEAVDFRIGVVSRDEPVLQEASLDGCDRAEDPGVVRRQEADQGGHQEAGVEPVRAV